jgi:hypothetical protein
MSSDAMTYALERGGGESDPRTYKVRIVEEWRTTTIKCGGKKRDKSRLCNICKYTNKICKFNDCFLRFCQTIKF